MLNQELGFGWAVEIDRGPDWLFISLHGHEPFDPAGIDLAVRVWRLVDQEFVNRLVLEMDNVPILRSELVGELVRLLNEEREKEVGSILFHFVFIDFWFWFC